MYALRTSALTLFGLLLVGCVLLEVVEAVCAVEGNTSVLLVDMESEESEEGQEEEKEGQKDKKSELEAFMHANRIREAMADGMLHALPPPQSMQSLVAARIWEPPELG